MSDNDIIECLSSASCRISLGGTTCLTLPVQRGLVCCMRCGLCQGAPQCATLFAPLLQKTCVRQAVLDKWFPLACSRQQACGLTCSSTGVCVCVCLWHLASVSLADLLLSMSAGFGFCKWQAITNSPETLLVASLRGTAFVRAETCRRGNGVFARWPRWLT